MIKNFTNQEGQSFLGVPFLHMTMDLKINRHLKTRYNLNGKTKTVKQ